MITQLQTDYFPRPNRRSVKRKLTTVKNRFRRTYRLAMRKTNRAAVNWYARQYFLAQAYQDVRRAIRANEDIFIGTIIVAAVLAYAFATVASEVLFMFFATAYAVAEAFDISMVVLSVITLAVLGASLAWVAAFALNSMSIALMHGLTGKKQRSLRQTLRHGLRLTSRTALAWFIVAVMITGPLVAAATLSMALLKFGSADLLAALTVAPYVVIAALTWVIYALMQYSLVPYIAFFEPKLSFSQAIARSHQLVQRTGRIFLLFLYVGLAAALAACYGVSVFLENALRINQSLTISFGASLSLIAMNALMVVFYRKRRLARR
jgi:hypothetical protein